MDIAECIVRVAPSVCSAPTVAGILALVGAPAGSTGGAHAAFSAWAARHWKATALMRQGMVPELRCAYQGWAADALGAGGRLPTLPWTPHHPGTEGLGGELLAMSWREDAARVSR